MENEQQLFQEIQCNNNNNNLVENNIKNVIEILKKELKIQSEIDLIHFSINEIKNIIKWNEKQIYQLLSYISFPICSNIFTCTALELANDFYQDNNNKISLGCPILDKCLGGGILTKGITEIFGESSSGKTQLCLQLCLQVQLKENLNNGYCFYISTETKFPLKRLIQLLKPFQTKYKHLLPQNIQKEEITSKILTKSVPTIEELWELLENTLPKLLTNEKIKLVIIDSIAALFRFEFSFEECIERSNILWKQATQLKLLSDSFRVPFIIVNQVSDFFHNEKNNSFNTFYSNSSVIPALGLVWSNCINIRIMTSRTKKRLQDQHFLRKMKVIFAPHIPNNECYFYISQEGIFGFEET